jgi:hypothetical protein
MRRAREGAARGGPPQDDCRAAKLGTSPRSPSTVAREDIKVTWPDPQLTAAGRAARASGLARLILGRRPR